MTTYNLHRDEDLINQAQTISLHKITKHWFKILLALFALHIIFNKDVSIQVNFKDKDEMAQNQAINYEKLPAKLPTASMKAEPLLIPTKASKAKSNSSKKHTAQTAHVASKDFGNLSFILNPNLANKKNIPATIVNEKLENCRHFTNIKSFC